MLRPIPPSVTSFEPAAPIELNKRLYATNIRNARGGAAAGLASDTRTDTDLLIFAAEQLSQGDLPLSIVEVLRLGCLTALSKGTGRVRGIVAGDTFRKGVARTLAQQSAPMFENACMPFQYALSTRAGTDCVARAARALTELDGRKTFISIDSVGAFDHIRRAAMLETIRNHESLQSLLPFVRFSTRSSPHTDGMTTTNKRVMSSKVKAASMVIF